MIDDAVRASVAELESIASSQQTCPRRDRRRDARVARGASRGGLRHGVPCDDADRLRPTRFPEPGARSGAFGASASTGSPCNGARRELERSSSARSCVWVCHLGGGCSVTAVRDGRSIDTTMGFSPLEGVPMATRSGSIDAGALLYLQRARGVSVDELDRALNEDSGSRGAVRVEWRHP